MKFYQYKARCINVVDGDTIDVQIDVGFKLTTIQRLRLLGVNTPELHANDMAVRTRAQAAKTFTVDHVLNKKIGITTHKTDAFGRYLAEVFVPSDNNFDEDDFNEGYSLNDLLLSEGHAVPFKD